ncbi:MAG TPA: glycosyltransferase, partial [Candidatus Limnocylindrales bacterium]|nr:glycosyltransferase [Candidatus Limnocylindrales bacterium]
RLRALPLSVLIPIGSNIRADAASAVLRPDSTGTFEIVYFGLVNRGKGLDQLLEALAGLRSDGLPAHLTIIGSAGSSDPTNQAYEAELRGKVPELNLSDHVAFTGFLPEAEVDALLQHADAVALPFLDGASLRRGSLLAALRAGCAIVTTTPTVRVEAFSDEDSMLLVAPGDTAALNTALARLAADPALRTRLRAGAAKASEQFSWPAIAAAAAEFFGRVLAGKGVL